MSMSRFDNLSQAQPAFTFSGFPLAKPTNSGYSIAERPKSVERITVAPHSSGVSIPRRFDWVLRGRYDSLEEAIAYARAQAGKGPEGDQVGSKGNAKAPEATVEKVRNVFSFGKG